MEMEFYRKQNIFISEKSQNFFNFWTLGINIIKIHIFNPNHSFYIFEIFISNENNSR